MSQLFRVRVGSAEISERRRVSARPGLLGLVVGRRLFLSGMRFRMRQVD